MSDEKTPFIDISHFQADPIDFAVIKATGCVAVVMKATQGEGGKDQKFQERVDPALAAGLLVGAYHYGTNASVADQAANFIETISPHAAAGESLLHVLDFERRSQTDPICMTLYQAEEFVRRIFGETGKSPVLYFGEYLKSIAAHVSATSSLRSCIPWIAQYGSKITNFPFNIWPGGAVMWQYDGNGTIDGISGHVDRDVFFGDEEAMRQLWRDHAVSS